MDKENLATHVAPPLHESVFAEETNLSNNGSVKGRSSFNQL